MGEGLAMGAPSSPDTVVSLLRVVLGLLESVLVLVSRVLVVVVELAGNGRRMTRRRGCLIVSLSVVLGASSPPTGWSSDIFLRDPVRF